MMCYVSSEFVPMFERLSTLASASWRHVAVASAVLTSQVEVITSC